MDGGADADDILEIDSPMEPTIDLPSEGEEFEGPKDTPRVPSTDRFGTTPDEEEDTVKIPRVEVPKHLRKPIETPREQVLDYQEHLPYPVESLEQMDARLDLIARKLVDCVEARDYDVGFVAWNHRLEMWLSLKYPMKRIMRARLAKLYWELAVLPGMEPRLTELFASMCMTLIESKKRIDIRDMQLDWEPMYKILEKEIFPKQRKTGHTTVFATLLTLTEFAARFFPPHHSPSMLSTFLPKLDGTSLNSCLATQAFLCHFVPTSHPLAWRTMIFKLWESFASEHWDDQWLDLLSRLSVKHVDPNVSDPRIETWLKRISEGEDMEAVGRELAMQSAYGPDDMDVDFRGGPRPWKGIRQDVGIFTEREWSFIMTKCLRAFSVPVGSSKARRPGGAFLPHGSNTGAANADTQVSSTISSMKKPSDKLHSFAVLIVYNMSKDGPATPDTPTASEIPTPTRGSEVNLPSLFATAASFGPARPSSKPPTYLAGSKALESLSKLLQATESFFHPSNYGGWQSRLCRFLHNICWEFIRRWREEEKPDCPTPVEWRLTETIRREFALTIRPVALLAMFCKDPMAMAAAQAAIKSLAYLEPGLIIPPVLDRALPALEGLLETHRTTACISTLATLGLPLVERSLYPPGAKHLATILELLLPGIDLNDAAKTMSTTMFIILGVATVRLDDVTGIPSRRPVEADKSNGDGPALLLNGDADFEQVGARTREEEDALARESTASLPDWSAKFIRQILNLFENLPEPGKNNRAGGKMEEQLISMVITDLDYICRAMSDDLFDATLKRYFEYIATNARTNTVKSVGAMANCFTRANGKKTFDLLFPFCARNIKYELANGASSVRTTSTSSPEGSDLMLHWYSSILIGCVPHAGDAILGHKEAVLDLIEVMVRDCKHERGSTYATRFLSSTLGSLLNVYTNDVRALNKDEWESEDVRADHPLYWGKQYKVKGVKIQWHSPSQPEIDFAVEILEKVTVNAIDVVERLIKEPDGQRGPDADKIWKNDFVRHCYVIKSSFNGSASLAELGRPDHPGAPATDLGDTVPGYLDDLPSAASGICLEFGDPRHARVMTIRRRAASTIHEAIQRLHSSGVEDSIDSVKILVSTTRTLLLDYPLERGAYEAHKKSHDFLREWIRTSRAQKSFPRALWVRRASLYHYLRMRYNSLYRRRSEIDDLLIRDLCELSLSQYTTVRKVSQRALDLISQSYDGVRTMLFDTLFDALKPGTDPDRMKGALHVLGTKMFSGLCLQDWRYGPRYFLQLLQCQHQDKPSIQTLVAGLLNDIIIRLFEISSLKSTLTSSTLQAAIDNANATISLPVDKALVQKLAGKAQGRKAHKDEAYDSLVPQLLQIAQDPSTHWKYALNATRLLRQLLRRDRPLDPIVATFFAKQMTSELPNKRVHAFAAITKLLHFVKLRTLAKTDEDLLLQQTHNPLKIRETLPDPLPPNFTQQFIESFNQPLSSSSAGLLVDKISTGWLVWGRTVDFYKVPPEEGTVIDWDAHSSEALIQLGDIFASPDFWKSVTAHLSQEHTRNYLSAENVAVIKSIFQVFGVRPWELVRPILEAFIVDTDRHKQRAAAELLGGILRGTKHWPLKEQHVVWDWLTPRLQKLVSSVTPDTQPAWEMFVEYVLSSRDPRRNQPLVDFIAALDLDKDTSEAFGTAKSQYLIGCVIRSLSWHIEPWADRFLDMYWNSLDHPYAEVRNAISLNLRALTELRLHPSFPSTEALLKDSISDDSHMTQLMSVDSATTKRIDDLVVTLQEARSVRLPAQHGSQTYDKAATTVLTWLWSSLNDFRVTTVFPFTTRLLPELFKMQELVDNQELTQLAKAVLMAISGMVYPLPLVGPTLEALLDLLRTSESWRIRLDVLPVLQVFFFHQLYLISDDQINSLLESLCDLLRDSNHEVREAAATSLSGIVRCSQRRAILGLKARFLKVIREVKLPRRRLDNEGRERAGYQELLVKAHSGVLGATALINAFPYEVPSWMPDLLIETLGTHTSSPAPISTTVKQTLSDFKKSHQDSWTEDQKAFTEDQLASLNDLLIGSSYYA